MPSVVTGGTIVLESAAQTLQAAAGGTGNGSSVALPPSADLVTITMSGGIATVILESSFDGGAVWDVAFARDLLAGVATLISSITTTVATQRFLYDRPPGATHLRARVSAFVSGAITATVVVRQRT